MSKWKRKSKPKSIRKSKANSIAASPFADATLVSGPKLRQILDVSAVTLWRWRHDQQMGFPSATFINGRMYFPWARIAAWLESQQGLALRPTTES
jgi:hypothetical protein